MTSNAYRSLALAALCVLSIGVSATTLESSMGTDPDDVVDLDWDRVPVGEEAAADVNRQIKANVEEHAEGTSEQRAEEGPTEKQVQQSGEREEGQSSGGLADELEDAPGGAGAMEQLRSSAQQAAGTAPQPDAPRDWLWLLVAIALLCALLAIGYRYRDRLGFGADSPDTTTDPPWPPDEPTSEVDRAWLAMVRRLDVERPWTKTPAEFATAAAAAGMDRDAVGQVTAAFQEVRYGGAAITERQRERARAALRRLGLSPEGERT